MFVILAVRFHDVVDRVRKIMTIRNAIINGQRSINSLKFSIFKIEILKFHSRMLSRSNANVRSRWRKTRR